MRKPNITGGPGERDLFRRHGEGLQADREVIEAQRDKLADALEEILPFMRGYAQDADPDDPIHERLPRWEAALRAAGRLP